MSSCQFPHCLCFPTGIPADAASHCPRRAATSHEYSDIERNDAVVSPSYRRALNHAATDARTPQRIFRDLAQDLKLVSESYLIRNEQVLKLEAESAQLEALCNEQADTLSKQRDLITQQAVEIEKWHRAAMDAGVVVHVGGSTSHPMRRELARAQTDLEHWRQEVGKLHTKLEKQAVEIERLNAAETLNARLSARAEPDAWKLRTETAESKLADALKALEIFGSHKNWSLSFVQKTFCDDDDRPEDNHWVVHAETGSYNDREWSVIGMGKTPAEAIARAAQESAQ